MRPQLLENSQYKIEYKDSSDCSPLKSEQGTQANYVHLSRDIFQKLSTRAPRDMRIPKDQSTNPDSEQKENDKNAKDDQPDLLANIMK